MLRRLLPGLALPVLFACQAPKPCGEVECKEHCGKAAPASSAGDALGLSPEQISFLEPLMSDLKAGVRAWDDKSVGVCTGQGKECGSFVGREVVEPLPAGQYMLRAELAVPKLGGKGTWQLRYELECEIVIAEEGGERTTSYTRDKTYDVHYIGDERGYRLSPLHTIESPRKRGTETCRYTLTGLGPATMEPMRGGWVIPEAEPEAEEGSDPVE